MESVTCLSSCSVVLRYLVSGAGAIHGEFPLRHKRTWLDKLDDLLKANLLHLRSNFERLRNGLAKCRDYIFNFLENPAIPPDNNASERGIRKLKIKQKVSGTFRSDNGADAFFSIHSIADTAWKNGQSQLQAIHTILSL